MLLELDYSLCNAMKIPFKFRAIKRFFGAKPNQFKFMFTLVSTKRSLFKKVKTQIINNIKRISKWFTS